MLNRDEAETGLATIIFDRSALDQLLPHWTELCNRSAEDSVYYAPHYAMPLLHSVAARTHVRIVTAWEGDRLVALLPVVVKNVSVPGIVAAGRAWQTEYTFNCLPLLDREQPEAAALALLDGLSSLKPAEWILPEVNADGAVCRALTSALAKRGAPWALRRAFERASLSAGPSFEEHMQSHVSSKRRRELARNRRRLEETGTVSVRTETAGAGLAAAVQAFLTLEASGWKGERGTALACRPATKAFAEMAFATPERKASRVDLLLLDGKPIAAGVVVFSGETGFTVKGAYDEKFASYSAGLLLEQEVIKSFLTDKWARRLDAATNGSHVIDYLWPDRVKVADLVFSLARTAPETRMRTLISANDLAEKAKGRLKRILGR